MIALAICAALATADLAVQPPWLMEEDPFRRCAMKALAGEFGDLQAWQMRAYQVGLMKGVKADKWICLTAYLGTDADGKHDAFGQPCTMRTIACNRFGPRKNGWPVERYIWTKYGIRQVLDCGAWSNDRQADKRGCDLWADYWFPTGHAACAVSHAACAVGSFDWTPTRGALIEP